MDDIPLLEDIVTDTGGNHSNDNYSKDNHSQQAHQKSRSLPQAGSTNDPKENPFLPYEHLARLALEREQFTQSIEAFTENLKLEKPYRERTPATRTPSLSNKNDAIVQAITNKVIKQLTPLIEDQIATELNAYFDAETKNP